MKKNRLLLEQKRFLSFSNYKNIIKYSFNANHNTRLIINSKEPTLNLKLINEIKKSQNIDNRNVFNFSNNSNKVFDNNIRILSFNKSITKMNLSSNCILDIDKNQRNYDYGVKNILNINKGTSNDINELKNNFDKFHLNQRVVKSFDTKNLTNRNKMNYKNIIKCKTSSIYNSFDSFENNEENRKTKSIIKTKSANITTRKLCKESFKKNINEIILKKKGKRRFKYKIIGTLTTEPNQKFLKKT